jgi:hypothetical protein
VTNKALSWIRDELLYRSQPHPGDEWCYVPHQERWDTVLVTDSSCYGWASELSDETPLWSWETHTWFTPAQRLLDDFTGTFLAQEAFRQSHLCRQCSALRPHRQRHDGDNVTVVTALNKLRCRNLHILEEASRLVLVNHWNFHQVTARWINKTTSGPWPVSKEYDQPRVSAGRATDSSGALRRSSYRNADSTPF